MGRRATSRRSRPATQAFAPRSVLRVHIEARPSQKPPRNVRSPALWPPTARRRGRLPSRRFPRLPMRTAVITTLSTTSDRPRTRLRKGDAPALRPACSQRPCARNARVSSSPDDPRAPSAAAKPARAQCELRRPKPRLTPSASERAWRRSVSDPPQIRRTIEFPASGGSWIGPQ